MTFETFEQFYNSFWQQPVLLCAVAFFALVFVSRFKGKKTYFLLFGLIALCDAWLTSNEVFGIGVLSAPLAMIVPISFVFLGDFRYFLLMERHRPQGKVAIALLLSALVPCLSAVVQKNYPAQWQSPRHLFLTYEVMFLLLLTLYDRLAWKNLSLAVTPRLRDLTFFVGLYYGIWASSDMLILGLGLDRAYGLRTVANVLYYGGFMIVAFRCLSGSPQAISIKK